MNFFPSTPVNIDWINTPAFEGLQDLINFIGSFVSAPIFFGISVINILVITFAIHYLIGIFLGGIEPRSPSEVNQNTTIYNRNLTAYRIYPFKPHDSLRVHDYVPSSSSSGTPKSSGYIQ